MKISIRDIGVVHEADIKLDGLTVIAGANGIGKSAIGKAIYCLAQSIVKLSEHSSNDMFKRFTKYLFKNIAKEDKQLLRSIIQPHNTHYNRNELNNIFTALRSKYPQLVKDWQNDDDNRRYSFDHRLVVAESHDDLIQSVFKSSYHNKVNKNNSSSIKIDFPSKALKTVFDITDNKSILGGNFGTQYIGTPTLIESPLTLTLHHYIRENLAFQNAQNHLLPDYIRDLVQKISESSYTPDYNKPLCLIIQNIIDGQVVIIDDQLFYKDNEDINHPIQNVAAGIKSFGLIQLLLAGGNINKDSLLIIDEPEIHLHPSWQVKYAEVLVALIKEGIPVLLTSHSSYFIEALDVYTQNEQIADQLNVYLGEMTEKGSVFKDVTEDLEPVYKAFAAPMVELMVERSRGTKSKKEVSK
ncbi:MAG: AAA family ATPase [Aureispira sp.]